MGLGTLTLLTMLWAPGQTLPADVVPFNQAKMEIPIRYDPAKKNEIRDLLLYISRNQGESWEQYYAATPDKDTVFPFTATTDGIYWFQIVIVDKQGRRDPADPKRAPVSPLKVLIDTKPPVVVVKSLETAGDEATVTWEMQEANPDWSKFQIDYRGGESTWQNVEAQPAPSGNARFRFGQQGPLTVRIQAVDMAGNRAEATKDAAPPMNVLASNTIPAPQASMRVGLPADVAPPLNTQPNDAMIAPPPVTEPLLPPARIPDRPLLPPASNDPIRNDIGSPLAVSPGSVLAPSGVPLPAAQIINVARFDLAYDVDQKGPSGVGKAEVWVTRDTGKSWQKWSTTEKTESPLTVDLATRNNPQVEGIYGLKIVLQSGAGLSKGPPMPGEAPDMCVDVDLTPPVVKIYEPLPDPNQKDTMILRWQAVDRNLASEPITLEWAEQADGPWSPIVGTDGSTPLGSSAPMVAKRLPNSGQYSWRLPPSFPTHRVYLRVTARDAAGNVAEAHTPHPILVDTNKPVAKIHGIIGASAQERR